MGELVSMKLTKQESKEAVDYMAPKGPSYPYGLRLQLDKDTLEKLGMKTLPPLKTKLSLEATVEVCSASESSSLYGDSKSLELQITELELDTPEEETNEEAKEA